MINRKKRKNPLYSIEEICKNNGVKYDNSHSKKYIVLKDSDGNLYKVDSSFNIFENCYSNYYDDCMISTQNYVIKSELKSLNTSKELVYKKEDTISEKTKCNYQSKSNSFDKDMFDIILYTAA